VNLETNKAETFPSADVEAKNEEQKIAKTRSIREKERVSHGVPTPRRENEQMQKLGEMIDTFKGRQLYRQFMNELLNPSNLETLSDLKTGEIKALTFAMWLDEEWPTIYFPLLDWVVHLLELKLSHNREARKELINALEAEAERRKQKVVMREGAGGREIEIPAAAVSEKKKSRWHFW
jgi:hypothetical protein